jgi:hypothetical protein
MVEEWGDTDVAIRTVLPDIETCVAELPEVDATGCTLDCTVGVTTVGVLVVTIEVVVPVVVWTSPFEIVVDVYGHIVVLV